MPSPPSSIYQGSLLDIIPKDYLNDDYFVQSYIIESTIYKIEFFTYSGSNNFLEVHFFCEPFFISNSGKITKIKDQYFLGRVDLTHIESYNLSNIAVQLLKKSLKK